MSELKQRFPRTREKSLGTLSAYYGDYESLAHELGEEGTRQRIRTYSETAYDEVIGAIQALGRIERSVTIIHGPPGCGAAKLEDYLRKDGSPWLITNIDENDSILGADDKLREAIERAYALYRPDIIFVLATPVVAINNDDIQSVVIETADALAIPVVPVFAAGFRSKSAIYGYDLAYHALVKYVLSKEKKTATAVAAINLFEAPGSGSLFILQDLSSAGITVHSNLEKVTLSVLKNTLQAAASITLDQDASHFLLRWLEEEHDVVHLQEAAPIGIANTERWLLAAAGTVGSSEQAQAYIEAKKAAVHEVFDLNRLEGVNVFIDLSPEQAFGISELVAELGGTVAGIAISHADCLHGDRLKQKRQGSNTAVYVQQGQPFEKINVLGKLKPDLYIGRAEDAVWAARAGVAAVAVDSIDIYGFEGAKALSLCLTKSLRNTALSSYISKGGSSSYEDSWLRKSAHWYIKQEVK